MATAERPRSGAGDSPDPDLVATVRACGSAGLYAYLTESQRRVHAGLRDVWDQREHQALHACWEAVIKELEHGQYADAPVHPCPAWLVATPVPAQPVTDWSDWVDRQMGSVRVVVRYLAAATGYDPAVLAELADIEGQYFQLLQDAVAGREDVPPCST